MGFELWLNWLQQYSHLSKKVEKKRPLLKHKNKKEKVLQYRHCYTTNVFHELPESANVWALVCTIIGLTWISQSFHTKLLMLGNAKWKWSHTLTSSLKRKQEENNTKTKQNKKNKTPIRPVCFPAHTSCIQIPLNIINKNHLCRASSNIRTSKAGGSPISTVNCSSVFTHTHTHMNHTSENIFTLTSACLVILH